MMTIVNLILNRNQASSKTFTSPDKACILLDLKVYFQAPKKRNHKNLTENIWLNNSLNRGRAV